VLEGRDDVRTPEPKLLPSGEWQQRRPGGLALIGREPFFTPARTLLDETGCLVRRYCATLRGRAAWSSKEWWIDVPPPTTALRFSIFAHEVGHHVLHRDFQRGSKPRWLIEVEAEDYSRSCFERFGLEMPDEVHERDERHIDRMLYKAIVRGADPTFPRLPEHWRYLLETPLRGRWVEHALACNELKKLTWG